MPVSKKVIAQALAHGVGLVAGYMLARQGLHVPVGQSSEVAAIASMLLGPTAGYLAKDEQSVEAVVSDAERLFTVVAESGANPRSALASQRPTAAPVGTPAPTENVQQ